MVGVRGIRHAGLRASEHQRDYSDAAARVQIELKHVWPIEGDKHRISGKFYHENFMQLASYHAMYSKKNECRKQPRAPELVVAILRYRGEP